MTPGIFLLRPSKSVLARVLTNFREEFLLLPSVIFLGIDRIRSELRCLLLTTFVISIAFWARPFVFVHDGGVFVQVSPHRLNRTATKLVVCSADSAIRRFFIARKRKRHLINSDLTFLDPSGSPVFRAVSHLDCKNVDNLGGNRGRCGGFLLSRVPYPESRTGALTDGHTLGLQKI